MGLAGRGTTSGWFGHPTAGVRRAGVRRGVPHVLRGVPCSALCAGVTRANEGEELGAPRGRIASSARSAA